MRYIGLFILLFALACDSHQEILTKETDHYTMQYPSTWELDESGKHGPNIVLYAESEGLINLFKENINITEQDLSENPMTLDEFVDLSESQVENEILNGDLLYSKRKKSKKGSYHEIIFTGNMYGNNLKWKQYYFLDKRVNKAYVVTFTAEVEKFDDYKIQATEIMDSFTLK